MSNAIYKVRDTAYTMREDESRYTVLRLLPFDEYFTWYLGRRDEIEFISNERWLRIFTSDDLRSALPFMESVIGNNHKQGDDDDTLVA